MTDRAKRRDQRLLRLIAVELVGSLGVVRQAAAQLRADKHVTMWDHAPDTNTIETFQWAGGGLARFERKLPSGPVHALFLHPQAVPDLLDPAKTVYAVRREADLAHAYRLLNAALPLPMLPEWTPWLLEEGRAADLVFELQATGLWAVEIVPRVDRWAALVQRGVRTGALRWPS